MPRRTKNQRRRASRRISKGSRARNAVPRSQGDDTVARGTNAVPRSGEEGDETVMPAAEKPLVVEAIPDVGVDDVEAEEVVVDDVAADDVAVKNFGADEMEELGVDKIVLDLAVYNRQGSTYSPVYRVNGYHAIQVILRKIDTAIKCPCPDERCQEVVRVGKHGALGDGEEHCPHCGSGGNWPGLAEFTRHLKTRYCQDRQTVKFVTQNPRSLLGPQLSYEISNVDYRVDEGGTTKFKCPMTDCGAVVNWAGRYLHCVKCYPAHGRPLPHTNRYS